MANLSMFKFLKNLFHRDYDENLGGTTIGSGSKNDSLHDVINGALDSAEEKKNGILGSLFSSSSPLTALVNELTSYLHTLTRGQLTGAEREQNVFNAEQAAIQRGFEERMSNTAFQRQVADMQAAGINPAVAFGSGGASTPSGSAASGSASAGSPAAVFDLILGLQNLKMQKQIAELQSFTAIKNEQSQSDTAIKVAQINANSQQKVVGMQLNQSERESLRNYILGLQKNTHDMLQLTQDIKESISRIALNMSQEIANRASAFLSNMSAKQIDILTPLIEQNYAFVNDAQFNQNMWDNLNRQYQAGFLTDEMFQVAYDKIKDEERFRQSALTFSEFKSYALRGRAIGKDNDWIAAANFGVNTLLMILTGISTAVGLNAGVSLNSGQSSSTSTTTVLPGGPSAKPIKGFR